MIFFLSKIAFRTEEQEIVVLNLMNHMILFNFIFQNFFKIYFSQYAVVV